MYQKELSVKKKLPEEIYLMNLTEIINSIQNFTLLKLSNEQTVIDYRWPITYP